MSKTYRINEIFYSIQGEGFLAGTPMVFLRFSGCNLTCAKETHGFDCDTEFISGRAMTAEEIIEEVKRVGGPNASWVCITGGEPLLQLDKPLAEALVNVLGMSIALETNGTKPMRDLPIDWLACSPKVAEHAIRLERADELRYVRGVGQGIPKPTLLAQDGCYFLSPAFDGDQMDREAVSWCVRLVKENPKWRLSIQQHKLLKVR